MRELSSPLQAYNRQRLIKPTCGKTICVHQWFKQNRRLR